MVGAPSVREHAYQSQENNSVLAKPPRRGIALRQAGGMAGQVGAGDNASG